MGAVGPEGRFVQAGDVRFHLLERGTGAATVFLHGGGPGCTAWTDFGPVVPLFAADRRCLLVDLLQYGRSSKTRITGPMWDFHADRTALLLDALGLDRADLVCNSWGGTIALATAARHPDRVRRLVVTGSMPVFHGATAPLPEGGRRGRNARDAYYGGTGPTREKMRDLMARLEWFDPAAIPDETVDLRFAQSLDPEEMALAAASDSPRGEWQDLSDVLPAITAPTLFCWGMHDAFLTPDYPLMLASRMPHGHLYVMDRAGHHLQEERPREYHAVVSAWLDAG
ncbi:MAG: alpha/beta hydrolase [Pseudonocardiales bacterium]|nr:alpha/beta hydrolase [Pseudonocardiales bacterium]